MNGQEYLQQLEQRLAHYYDKKPLPKAPAFVLAAELNAADEGYFIVPNLKTYSVQHNEYLYAAHFDKKLTADMAAPYLQFTKDAMAALKTTTEHMSRSMPSCSSVSKALRKNLWRTCRSSGSTRTTASP